MIAVDSLDNFNVAFNGYLMDLLTEAGEEGMREDAHELPPFASHYLAGKIV